MKTKVGLLSVLVFFLAFLMPSFGCSGDDDDENDSATDDDSDNTGDDDDNDDNDNNDNNDNDDNDDNDDSTFDPSVILGRTYSLDIPLSAWTVPAGVGDIIGYYVPILLFEPRSADDGVLDLLATVGAEEKTVVQDECNLTTDFADSVLNDDGSFSFGPQDFALRIEGVSAGLHQAYGSGTFLADGSGFDNGVLGGLLDARELLDFLLYGLDEICLVTAIFGAPCVACPADGEVYCVEIKAEGFSAATVSGLSLTEIGSDDLGPECDDDDDTAAADSVSANESTLF
ncbi:MAG: hypothetical protein GX444_05790 [Myxococcales bacterium]|nr:hypothetical protein [Myxococcales bacterium]